MNGMRTIRYVLWGLVAVAAIAAGLLFSGVLEREDEPVSAAVTMGEPFTLVTDAGDPITDADLVGHPSLMFFGFTYCPDVCPTALAEVTAWLSDLGNEADDLAVYFVTVDPERDQPEQLGTYLTAFDPRIVGVTGPVDDVHALLDSYHVYYERYDAEGVGYLMDHGTSFYMLDRQGDFAGLIGYTETTEGALEKIRGLIDG